jgi:RNA polymerase sigma factor (sigma-70 family)
MRSEADFAALSERYRHELRVHCYRMLGSPDDAEDLVQDTFLRAWRGRESLQGHSAFRAWLYRIATNACLDRLDRRSREPLPRGMTRGEAGSAPPPTSVPWLPPCPDRLLDAPETAAVDTAVAALLREDARCGQQAGAGGNPLDEPVWYAGRKTILDAWAPALHGPDAVGFRFEPTGANRQPAAGAYIRMPGETTYRPFGLTVLRVEAGLVAEVSVFSTGLFPSFGLPDRL